MKIKTPDEYVAKQPPEYRSHLDQLRRIIKETIPIAKELISYQVICYKYHFMLIGLGTKKGNCSLYTMSSSLVKRMKKELSGIEYSESTIYFPISKDLPIELIKDIIKERIIENEQRADIKNVLNSK